ncbi:hypothetical protein SEA_FORZA_95 [Gordonia phage Forza]|uniref:Uncharacterized protein n=1 Tax=Gordonia phage Forza TaxID=2571247 RepID=A0A650EZH9_9CAUD|nr:hypothetical protein PP303_gp095 [Gordonia phage Forza]QEM41562.1 hypothetical protein SEA_BOOPY_95 [Gordonia phage Boopy]QGT55088.1 hypothetical protein SEA_FORZA_95 [Gordonia phage Forza]UXE04236.1 hypothetical protein SEA_BLUENGOLD_94 [Gordonia phage BlueNGold]WBF03876.1 hypothetical protein SEA_MAREELIH_93 [Gordonia phage Mareelih]
MPSPAMTDPTEGLRLSTAGQTMLEHVISAAQLQLFDLPSRRFVTTGPAVFDCEQVSVSLLRINSGMGMNPGGELIQGGPNCNFGWSLVADIAIVRKGPTPNNKGIIPPSKLDAGTEQSSQDIFILQEAIETLAEASMGGFTASLIPLEIEGGFVAVMASIQMVM